MRPDVHPMRTSPFRSSTSPVWTPARTSNRMPAPGRGWLCGVDAGRRADEGGGAHRRLSVLMSRPPASATRSATMASCLSSVARQTRSPIARPVGRSHDVGERRWPEREWPVAGVAQTRARRGTRKTAVPTWPCPLCANSRGSPVDLHVRARGCAREQAAELDGHEWILGECITGGDRDRRQGWSARRSRSCAARSRHICGVQALRSQLGREPGGLRRVGDVLDVDPP